LRNNHVVLPNIFKYGGVVRQFGRKRNLRVMDKNWKYSDKVAMDEGVAGAGFQVLLEGIGLVVVFKPEIEIRSKKTKGLSDKLIQ